MRIERFEDIEIVLGLRFNAQGWSCRMHICSVRRIRPGALSFGISSRHTSAGAAYKRDQRKKSNPERWTPWPRPDFTLLNYL